MKTDPTEKREDYKNALYDSSRRTAEMMKHAVGGDPENFDIIYNLAFSEPYPMNMRCANVCRHCCEPQPELLFPYLDELPVKLEQCKTDGVKRCFLKIYADHLSEKDFRNVDKLAEVCFNFLLNVKETIGVRVYCMEIIYKLSFYEPDLKIELLEIARFETESPFSGMVAKAQNIIKRITKHDQKLR